MRVRPAEPSEFDRIEALLRANDLPTRDLQASPGTFFVAEAGEQVVGAGGVEQYGTNGLLRSVVVAKSRRGRGYGRALTGRLERHARAEGVETLYLLTTTAAAFFRAQGFETTERADAPAQIQETTEFSELCPSAATCLRKSL
jgi:amino-acid N-acetyltransferase